MRAVRENIKPRSCCIDRATARKICDVAKFKWSVLRHLPLNALYKTVFGESETVLRNHVTVVAMVIVTFENGGLFVFNKL